MLLFMKCQFFDSLAQKIEVIFSPGSVLFPLSLAGVVNVQGFSSQAVGHCRIYTSAYVANWLLRMPPWSTARRGASWNATASTGEVRGVL